MSPDGEFFVTSAGTMGSTVSIGAQGQESQVTFQGECSLPVLNRDGRTLFYAERKEGAGGQLMRLALESQEREPVLPGVRLAMDDVFPNGFYDISPDGRRIVLVALAEGGGRKLWLCG